MQTLIPGGEEKKNNKWLVNCDYFAAEFFKAAQTIRQ